MPVQPIPDGYHTITPYLIVNDAARLIAFLKDAFGAKELGRHLRPDDGTVMHAEFQVGTSRLMLADARAEWRPMPASIFLYVENSDDAYAKAVSAGGESLMEPTDQIHGNRYGGVKDPTGNHWWVATRVEDVSEEEFQRRAAKQAEATSA